MFRKKGKSTYVDNLVKYICKIQLETNLKIRLRKFYLYENEVNQH